MALIEHVWTVTSRLLNFLALCDLMCTSLGIHEHEIITPVKSFEELLLDPQAQEGNQMSLIFFINSRWRRGLTEWSTGHLRHTASVVAPAIDSV